MDDLKCFRVRLPNSHGGWTYSMRWTKGANEALQYAIDSRQADTVVPADVWQGHTRRYVTRLRHMESDGGPMFLLGKPFTKKEKPAKGKGRGKAA